MNQDRMPSALAGLPAPMRSTSEADDLSQTMASLSLAHHPHHLVLISNIPPDTTLREAFLVFSLCLDQVTFVDIVQEPSQGKPGSHEEPVIVARFVSAQTARQVAQILDQKRLFGSAFAPVKVEYQEDRRQSVQSVGYDLLQGLPIAQHVQSQPQQAQPQQQSQPQQQQQQQQQQPPPPPQHSRLLFQNPFQQTAPMSPMASLAPITSHMPPALPHQSSASSSSSNNSGKGASVSAQKVLDQLTSPVAQIMGMSEYDQLVRPWSRGSQPGSKILPEPLTINTSITSSPSTPLSATTPSGTAGGPGDGWDRRAHYMSAPPTGVLSPTNKPKSSPPPAADLEQSIPELALLKKIPPPTNPADNNPPCNTLYVGNLPPDATEAELRQLFESVEGFRRLSFKNKQSNGNSHHGPMCFVEYENVRRAAVAMAQLYGYPLRRSAGNGKGGLRLSFSKNPLGVRGPGQGRRGSSNNYHAPGSAPGSAGAAAASASASADSLVPLSYRQSFSQYSYQSSVAPPHPN